jgi:hypothetical protein
MVLLWQALVPEVPYCSIGHDKKWIVSYLSCHGRRYKSDVHLSALNSAQSHLLLPCTLTKNNNTPFFQTQSMIDSGATAEGFIDKDLALKQNYTLHELAYRRRLRKSMVFE